jgi:hypothetical protein
MHGREPCVSIIPTIAQTPKAVLFCFVRRADPDPSPCRWKSRFTVACFLLAACGAIRGEEKAASPSPQPRLRLDAARQAAVPEPEKSAEEKKPADVPYMLDRLIVKQRAERLRQRAITDPTGPFDPFRGGRFLRRDIGAFRVELGIWPNIDIFEEEARFAPQKTKALFDFVRVKW